MSNNDDYMGDMNDNENTNDHDINLDDLSSGKKQIPIKLHIRKQEVKKIYNFLIYQDHYLK